MLAAQPRRVREPLLQSGNLLELEVDEGVVGAGDYGHGREHEHCQEHRVHQRLPGKNAADFPRERLLSGTRPTFAQARPRLLLFAFAGSLFQPFQ